MKLDFAKFYDVTDVAKEFNKEYNQYEKIFVCVDVNDFWVARILKGYTCGIDGYEEAENNYLLERNQIRKDAKSDGISNIIKLKRILKEDVENGFENWDVENCDDLEDAIEMLDDGFGIGKLNF